MPADPVTDALMAGAKTAVMEGFRFVSAKVYDALPCATLRNSADASSADKLFCAVVGGFAGVDEQAWKKDVTNKLAEMSGKLDTIQREVRVIANGVQSLLTAVDLIDLKLDKIIQGQKAYEAMQSLQISWDKYSRLLAVTEFEEETGKYKGRLLDFFSDLIVERKIDRDIETIVASLTSATDTTVDDLLFNFVKSAKKKFPTPLYTFTWSQDLFRAYEGFASDWIIVLHRAYVLYTNAVAFFEMGKEAQDRTGTPVNLPKTPAPSELAKDRADQLHAVLDEYNRGLEWLILELSRPNATGLNPFFLLPGARDLFARADKFTSQMLDERHGIRGRVITMGDGFDGTLRLDLSQSAHTEYKPISKAEVLAGEPVDWWVARTTPRVYDEVHFASTWKIYRYYIPSYVHASDKAFQCVVGRPALPYDSDTMQVAFEEKAHRASFTEVHRAGGAFALLSGPWETRSGIPWYPEDERDRGVPNNDTGDARLEGGSPLTGFAQVRTQSVVDPDNTKRTLAALMVPQVAVQVRSGTIVQGSNPFKGLPNTHLRGATTVTIQSKKKIRFPDDGCIMVHTTFRPWQHAKSQLEQEYLLKFEFHHQPTFPQHDVFHHAKLWVGFTSKDLNTREPAPGETSVTHYVVREGHAVTGKKSPSSSGAGWNVPFDGTSVASGLKQKVIAERLSVAKGTEGHFRLQAQIRFNVESSAPIRSWFQMSVVGELVEAHLRYLAAYPCQGPWTPPTT